MEVKNVRTSGKKKRSSKQLGKNKGKGSALEGCDDKKDASSKGPGLLSKAKVLVTGVSAEDEAILKKYKFMLKIGQPEEAITHRMTKEGNARLIDILFGSSKGGKKEEELPKGVEMKPKINRFLSG